MSEGDRKYAAVGLFLTLTVHIRNYIVQFNATEDELLQGILCNFNTFRRLAGKKSNNFIKIYEQVMTSLRPLISVLYCTFSATSILTCQFRVFNHNRKS